MRTAAVMLLTVAVLACQQADPESDPAAPPARGGVKIVKSDEEWRKELGSLEYHVTREKGTEPPGTGRYYKTKTPGTYLCVCCGQELFSSDSKYDSGSGWPAFFKPVDEEKVELTEDRSLGTVRLEVTCARCDAHLGHVFDDGPEPTGLRYCVNSASLSLREKSEEE